MDHAAAILGALQEQGRTLQRISNRLDKMDEGREQELQETFRRALAEMAELRVLLKQQAQTGAERFEQIEERLSLLEAR